MILHRFSLLLFAAATFTVSAAPQALPSRADLDSQLDDIHSVMLPFTTSTATLHKRDRLYEDVRCGCNIKLFKGIIKASLQTFFTAVVADPALAELHAGQHVAIIDEDLRLYTFAINLTNMPMKIEVSELVTAFQKIINSCSPSVPGTAGQYGKGGFGRSGYAVGFMTRADWDRQDWDRSVWGSGWTTCDNLEAPPAPE